ncbi:10340_t:CDS:2 [Funneliformis geosporum]|nr:10340_t:CDS:2 [Funneliformis geosporum]
MSELTPFDWVEISARIDIKELDTDIEYWQEIILSFQENDQHHLDNQAKLNKQIRNSLQVIDEHKVQILTLIKRLNKLKEEIIKLGIENNNLDTQSQELKENKNNQEHKRFINHDAQLAKETKKYEKLKKKYQARGEKIRSLESLEQEIKELKDQQNKTKKQKDKVKTRLGEQVKNLKKLAKSKTDMKEDHQNQMTSLKIRLESEISVLKSDNSQLEYDLKVRTKQRDKARQKLRVIKHNKKKLKEKAQDRGVFPKEVPIKVEVPAKPVEKIIDTPFGEDLEVIKNIDLNSLEKELEINLGKEVKEKLMKATTYQELVAIRENELKKHLNQQKSKGNTHSTQLVQTPKRGLERY